MTIEEYFKQNNLNEDDFNSDQMSEIRAGLEAGLNVSSYAHPKFNSNQMWEIRESLLKENATKEQNE